jgi:hypothetical protein
MFDITQAKDTNGLYPLTKFFFVQINKPFDFSFDLFTFDIFAAYNRHVKLKGNSTRIPARRNIFVIHTHVYIIGYGIFAF